MAISRVCLTDFEFNNNKGTGNGQKCNRSSALIGDNQIIDKVPDKLSHCLFLSDLNSFENTVAGIYKFITVLKRQSNCFKKTIH